MNRTARHYAEAFVKARREGGLDEGTLVTNLLAAVDKHNDRRKLPAILAEIERLLVAERGGSHITVTSARALSPETRSNLENLGSAADVVTFSTDASLVAGLKITRNREHELDYSFSRAMSRLFA